MAGLSGIRVAEFFAGIGLVRLALEEQGFRVVFANDIDPAKKALYAENMGDSGFCLGDVRQLRGAEIPDVDLATASFPCTDLSVAGNRAGLAGKESGMFWEFARILAEMRDRKPALVLLENVLGFATSHAGNDLRTAISALNGLGYTCDLFEVDARHFVPQSRPRMFIVGSLIPLESSQDWQPSPARPRWVSNFVSQNQDLKLQAYPLPVAAGSVNTLSAIVERLPHNHRRWWTSEKTESFRHSLSKIQSRRLEFLESGRRLVWATAYRRTREGKATWEIRADGIAGCLRTARGGSSKQALVEAGHGNVRIRWMTPTEYARLQGVPHMTFASVSENAALSALGDAVCVPVVAWIAREYIQPVLARAWDKTEAYVG
ncbi:MAG: DNA cytosine methyltransferase [Actinomycetota bacterium]|nr:DNA cytosine methyltransferase [Actinomycetota bacterium]